MCGGAGRAVLQAAVTRAAPKRAAQNLPGREPPRFVCNPKQARALPSASGQLLSSWCTKITFSRMACGAGRFARHCSLARGLCTAQPAKTWWQTNMVAPPHLGHAHQAGHHPVHVGAPAGSMSCQTICGTVGSAHGIHPCHCPLFSRVSLVFWRAPRAHASRALHPAPCLYVMACLAPVSLL